MSISRERFTKVVIPIVNAALEQGLIDKTAPWLPLATQRHVRLLCVIDGDIPVAADVQRWEDGLCYFRWALWPTAPEVPLERPIYSYDWPGDVWGWASVDRRWDFRLDEFGEFHCRRPRLGRVDAIPRAPLDARMTTRL